MGTPAYMVDQPRTCSRSGWKACAVSGLTAGASAPDILVQQVIDRLRAMGALSVRKLPGVEETVRFPLPMGLGDKSMGQPG